MRHIFTLPVDDHAMAPRQGEPRSLSLRLACVAALLLAALAAAAPGAAAPAPAVPPDCASAAA
ncbi:MAG: hypothetical protein K2X49_15205, partial [Acetobacteraceae bacterium]|nr:hypothetical protein [Acetobacteraceae bacterium]